MNQTKIIRKIVFPALIIFIVSIGIILCQFPYRNSQDKKRVEKLKNHSSALTRKYQAYLTSTAQKIKAIPVDQRIISEIQTEILQESSGTKLFLWMSDTNGEFVFGVPPVVFDQFNSAFDKYSDVIQKDDYYQGRNDFLMKLIDKHNEIDFSEFGSTAPPGDDQNQWRFYKETFDTWNYSTNPTLILSSAVVAAVGEKLGELYVKIDDSANEEKYYSQNHIEERDLFALLIPIFGALAFFSGLLLWFLLPTWVYIDAQKRDVKNPILWAFLTLISFIFGLTVYLITRPATLKAVTCPQCEKELNGTKAFCPYCGFDVSSTICQQCQYPLKPDWKFCPSCRSEIRKQTSDSAE
ncbi:MAG: zinc ribbon domain-containing protein [bacterium]|nr:zinc ribbon domain-containing protein [bacterium]